MLSLYFQTTWASLAESVLPAEDIQAKGKETDFAFVCDALHIASHAP
jgi:hypothetical protein